MGMIIGFLEISAIGIGFNLQISNQPRSQFVVLAFNQLTY